MPEFFDAFISYGRADSRAFGVKLHDRLEAEGRHIWFDGNNIPLGVDFQEQINDGIEKSHNFIFIIAPHSVNSPYCLKEINLAIALNKRIIPVLHVEQIDFTTWKRRNPYGTQTEWKIYQGKGLHSSFPNMHPTIGKINWVYGREGIDDFDGAIAGILDLFDRHRSYVSQHTYFLNRALAWQRHRQQNQYLLSGGDLERARTWLALRFEDEQAPCVPTDLHGEYICESLKYANELMSRVFISYATGDRDIMQAVGRRLMAEGLTLWTSHTDIKTGVEFQEEIYRGIEKADNLVYLISNASLQSEYCQDEIKYAQSLNKRIVSLLVEPIDLATIPAELRALQFIDASDRENEKSYGLAIDKLLRELSEDAAYYEQHKVLLVDALRWQRQNQNPCVLLRGYRLRQVAAWLKTARQRDRHGPLPLQEAFVRESLRQPPIAPRRCFSPTPVPISISPVASISPCKNWANPPGSTASTFPPTRTFAGKFATASWPATTFCSSCPGMPWPARRVWQTSGLPASKTSGF